MSSAKRVQMCRNKLRLDDEKWEAYKEKDRERKRREYQLKKASMSDEERRAKEREKKKKEAAKKKLKASCFARPNVFLDTSFASPQSLGKAMKRATKSLPKNSPKKSNCWQRLCSHCHHGKRWLS